jgi:transcriptional regulator with GAF, ATPase, and Fis domain
MAAEGSVLIGSSPAFERVRRQIEAVATTSSTVLLSGETGCGKGVVARELHRLSNRRHRPFVHVDCGALASSVIDSELFGHERGAFTGAVERRLGRFERAQGGTLFLDEIGDLESGLQSKLLRVLQDREFERVGGSDTRTMTARVIAASNRDLRRAVSDGRFRADLLFRLNVFEIRIPPLRERVDDLSDLARRLLQQLAERAGVEAPKPSAGFLDRLACYAWPGNVRELMNLLERFVIEKPGQGLVDSHLDDFLAREQAWSLHGIETASAPWESGGTQEREKVAAALIAERGNVSRTARRLGVPRSTLRYWIRQLGLRF